MQLDEAKSKFLDTWGELASQWGISKSMSCVHAYLLIQPKEVCTEMIMDELDLSSGSVNTNLRSLIEWGLVYKTKVEGSRKDFFIAEKDMWTVFRQILINRKERELKPLLKSLNELSRHTFEDERGKEFSRMVKEMKKVTTQTDSALDTLAKSEESWFDNPFFKMIQ